MYQTWEGKLWAWGGHPPKTLGGFVCACYVFGPIWLIGFPWVLWPGHEDEPLHVFMQCAMTITSKMKSSSFDFGRTMARTRNLLIQQLLQKDSVYTASKWLHMYVYIHVHIIGASYKYTIVLPFLDLPWDLCLSWICLEIYVSVINVHVPTWLGLF